VLLPLKCQGGGPTELLDMKALELNRSEQDDIAERMRVEETRAQLAAAKAGMEKEAQRLREEQEAKEAKRKERETVQSSRFGAAAASLSGESSGIGGKWVPPHMRNAAPPSRSSGMGIGSSRFGNAMVSPAPGSGFQKKVDTMDEELFPSLATADMMLAQEEEQKAKMAGVPAWGAKKKPAIKKEEPPVEEAKPEPVAAPVPAPEAAAAQPVKPVLKKKKKKDLSTFQVS
jgi:predicted nucleic acid-binding Zn ribbon protein